MMFNKTFLLALVLYACCLAAVWGRPQLGLGQLPVPVDSLPLGNVAGTLGSAVGAATGSVVGGGLIPKLPVGNQGGKIL